MKSITASGPAPSGGWNTRDPLAQMKDYDAIVMENFYPAAEGVQIRPGAALSVSGFPGVVQTLHAWRGGGSSKLFGATNSDIYDCTLAGAAPAPSTSCTNGKWQSINFTTAAGHYLVMVNGADKLKLYDGTTWSDIDGVSVPAITGVATTELVNVSVSKKRLWFVRKNSSTAYYLPTASIGGALTGFPLGQEFNQGGKLVAIGNWSIDGGSGIDDHTVFVSSAGEVVVYRGTDPGDPANWGQVGTYYIAPPIGVNCLTQFGGDLLLLTTAGLFPLSKSLQSVSIERTSALSSKINTAFEAAARTYSTNQNWQTILYPAANLLLVNIPLSPTFSEQYAMNTLTGAWCKILGWPASSWLVFENRLMFASAASVCQAWVGSNDFGRPIVAQAQQAYSYLRVRARQKHVKLVRPVLEITDNLTIYVGVDTDFRRGDTSEISPSAPQFPSNWDISSWDSASWVTSYGSRWDEAIWDAAFWTPDSVMHQDWATVASFPGYALSFRLQITVQDVSVRWYATDIVYQNAGIL